MVLAPLSSLHPFPPSPPLTSQALDVLDGRRAPFQPHRYGNGGDTRDTDTQAPSSGGSSPWPFTPDPLHSPEGSPCSTEELDKGTPFRFIFWLA